MTGRDSLPDAGYGDQESNTSLPLGDLGAVVVAEQLGTLPDFAALDRGRGSSDWAVELCLLAIQVWFVRHGRVPTVMEFDHTPELPPTTRLRDEFGNSIADAIRAAGLEPRPQGRNLVEPQHTPCSIDGCGSVAVTRGLCRRDYLRALRAETRQRAAKEAAKAFPAPHVAPSSPGRATGAEGSQSVAKGRGGRLTRQPPK